MYPLRHAARTVDYSARGCGSACLRCHIAARCYLRNSANVQFVTESNSGASSASSTAHTASVMLCRVDAEHDRCLSVGSEMRWLALGGQPGRSERPAQEEPGWIALRPERLTDERTTIGCLRAGPPTVSI